MAEKIDVNVFNLEGANTGVMKHFDIEFSRPVSGSWVKTVLEWALILDSMGADMQDLAKESGRNLRAKFRIMTR